VQEPERAARAALFRSFVFYSVVLLGIVALLTWLATFRAYVALVLFGGIGVLVAYQVVQHYRDLREPLAESEGVVARVWSRADLIIALHSYYITVGRTVYRLQPEDFVPLELYVKVVHFPHTLNAVSVHEIVRHPSDPSSLI
jgi:xanthosine utilization system XapX-like protein